MSDKVNPAVAVAKEKRAGEQDVHTLSTGVRVRLLSVNAATITEVQMRIENPPVPTWFNEDKGREEDNPNHPDYLAACGKANEARALAMMDALALFGVELLDGLPEDDLWLRKLKLLARKGQLDLSVYDLDDEIDREFLYKKHIAISTPDWAKLMTLSGVPEEAVQQMEDSFPGDTQRDAD